MRMASTAVSRVRRDIPGPLRLAPGLTPAARWVISVSRERVVRRNILFPRGIFVTHSFFMTVSCDVSTVETQNLIASDAEVSAEPEASPHHSGSGPPRLSNTASWRTARLAAACIPSSAAECRAHCTVGRGRTFGTWTAAAAPQRRSQRRRPRLRRRQRRCSQRSEVRH